MVLSMADDEALELRVNGVFVMDSRETTAERALARIALDAFRGPATLLVGGLGLGFTLAEVLRNPFVTRVVVAEIEPDLVSWHRDGLIAVTSSAPPRSHLRRPTREDRDPSAESRDPSAEGEGRDATAGVLGDLRVQVDVGDVRDVVARQPAGSLDAIVLDVDNGPGFLVYDDNAAVYDADFLARCRTALRADGALAVWSADVSEDLAAALRSVFGQVVEHAVPVTLGSRQTSYHLYRGQRLR